MHDRCSRALQLLSIVAALSGVISVCGRAQAGPLDAGSCELVKTEQATLDAEGVRADVGRGADWGKSNLTPERLRLVARWIELEEQILFRCPRPKPAPSAATAALGASGAGKPAATGEASVSGQDAGAAPKPKKEKKKKTAKKPAAGEPGAEGAGTPPVEASKKASADGQGPPAKKKPKVNDAYSPVTDGSGTLELQHSSPGPAVQPNDSYKPVPLSP